MHVSPDGLRLALTILNTRERGIWIDDLTRRALRPVLRDGEAQWLAWSPDGRLFFYWLKDGRRWLAVLPAEADSTARPQVFYPGPGILIPVTFTPDGRLLGIRNSREIVTITFAGEQARVEPLHETRYAEGWPTLSPDGRWLAYAASGADAVRAGVQPDAYVRPFPGFEPALLVSTEGGRDIAWNGTGRELFYVALKDPRGRASMMAVDFTPGRPAIARQPRRLFDFDNVELVLSCVPARCFGVAPDGQHFYALRNPKPLSTPVVTHINIVPNWFEELKAKVPANPK